MMLWYLWDISQWMLFWSSCYSSCNVFNNRKINNNILIITTLLSYLYILYLPLLASLVFISSSCSALYSLKLASTHSSLAISSSCFSSGRAWGRQHLHSSSHYSSLSTHLPMVLGHFKILPHDIDLIVVTILLSLNVIPPHPLHIPYHVHSKVIRTASKYSVNIAGI